MADTFDRASAFVAVAVSCLRTKPALQRALQGLASDVRNGERSKQVEGGASALAAALSEQLDLLRLSAHGSTNAVELSSALTAASLVGSAACSKRGDLVAATALLDGALLRSRAEEHSAILRDTLAEIEAAYLTDVENFPCAKRQRLSEVTPSTSPPSPTSFSPPSLPPAALLPIDSPAVVITTGDDEALDERIRAATLPGTTEPVLVLGLALSWPARARWADLRYLRRVAGHRLVPIEVGAALLGKATDGVCEQTVLRTLACFIDEVILGGQAANAAGDEPRAVTSAVPVTSAHTRGYLAQHRLVSAPAS